VALINGSEKGGVIMLTAPAQIRMMLPFEDTCFGVLVMASAFAAR